MKPNDDEISWEDLSEYYDWVYTGYMLSFGAILLLGVWACLA